ncbi:MAG: TonB-dependent receptor [Pseudomonadota bacterium]
MSLLAVSASLAPITASAQRAAENVVRSADDAFGASVGDETIGLYSNNNVRGFSPEGAGNIRIEGLFIDSQASLSDRVISGSRIRSGLAAQGYLLPAPTGVVDFSLRRVGEKPVQSFIASATAFGGYDVAADLQMRAFDGLIEAAGGANYFRSVGGNGSRDISWNAGGVVHIAPSDRLKMSVFGDFRRNVSDQRWVNYFPGGSFLPPRIQDREQNVGQPWVEVPGRDTNIGLIAEYTPSIAEFQIGVFRSAVANENQAGQFFTDVQPDGSANFQAFLGPPLKIASLSMEARASRAFIENNRRHQVTLNMRARDRDFTFGGTTDFDFGTVFVEDFASFPEPAIPDAPQAKEDVQQITFGLAYQLQWASVGELNLGVQKTDYSRTDATPSEPLLESNADPILYNATAAIDITDTLIAYGGVVRGFEEGPGAPTIAVNRNEAPPAIETDQADAGLRWRIGKMTAVAGVFQIEKPFFALDANQFFGQAGVVQNRGVELSLAGPLFPSLQVVAGAAFFDPSLSGDPVDAGALSDAPIAFVDRNISVNMDYRPEWAPGWSADLGLFHQGEGNADNIGVLKTDPRTIVDFGMRKQFTYRGADLVVRARVENVFNTFGWDAFEGGQFFFQSPRSFSISLRADV